MTERIKKNKKTAIFKDMIKINGGKYTPSFFNEEREVFDLEVCKYLVTQDMWIELMEENPSSFEGGRRPIEGISWWDALEYCNKLSEKYSLEPVYDLSKKEEKVLRINQLGGEIEYPNVADFKKTEGFRLPTEVEWEWFARGGEVAIQDGKFYPNQEENEEYKEVENRIIEEESWYCKNSGNQTHDVGTKKPNQLKIYDCIGNVWEWCYDVDSSGYISEETPYIYDASQLDRRLRGGSWNENVENCTYFIRANEKMDSNSNNIGFRIVRTI